MSLLHYCYSSLHGQQSGGAEADVLGKDEVAVFITIGQSNADGSAFADEDEDGRLSAWYDNPDTNPGLQKYGIAVVLA